MKKPTLFQQRKLALNTSASSSAASSSSEELSPLFKKKLTEFGFNDIKTENDLFEASWSYIKGPRRYTILFVLLSTLEGQSLLESMSKNPYTQNRLCQKLFHANWNLVIDEATAWGKFFASFKAKPLLASWTQERWQRNQWCQMLCLADWDIGSWPPLWFRLIDHNGLTEFLMSLLRDASDSSGALLDKLLQANPKEKQGRAISLIHYILLHPEQKDLLQFLFFYRAEAFFNRLLQEDWNREIARSSILSCLLSNENGLIILEKVQTCPTILPHFIKKLQETAEQNRSSLSPEMITRLTLFLEQSSVCTEAPAEALDMTQSPISEGSDTAPEEKASSSEEEKENPHKEIIQMLAMDWRRVITDYGCNIAYQYARQGLIAQLFNDTVNIPNLEIQLIEKLLTLDWLETISVEGSEKSFAFLLAETGVFPLLFTASKKHHSTHQAVSDKVAPILDLLEKEEIRDISCNLNSSLQTVLHCAGFTFSSEEELLNADWDTQASSGQYQGLSLLYVLILNESNTQTFSTWIANPEKKELVLEKFLTSDWSVISSTSLYTGLPLLYFIFSDQTCCEILDELFNRGHRSDVIDKISAIDWGEAYFNDAELTSRTVLFHLLQENNEHLLSEIAKSKIGRQKLRRVIDLLKHNESFKTSYEKLIILLSLPTDFTHSLSAAGFNETYFLEDLLKEDWQQASSHLSMTLFFWIAAGCNADTSKRFLEVSDLMKNDDDKPVLVEKILEADFSAAPKESPNLPFIFWLIYFPDWLQFLVEIVQDLDKKEILLAKLHEMDIYHEYRADDSIFKVLHQTKEGRELLLELQDYNQKLELNDYHSVCFTP